MRNLSNPDPEHTTGGDGSGRTARRRNMVGQDWGSKKQYAQGISVPHMPKQVASTPLQKSEQASFHMNQFRNDATCCRPVYVQVIRGRRNKFCYPVGERGTNTFF